MKHAILVGAGGMGRAWARNLTSAGIGIEAWVDVRPAAAAEAAAELELTIPHTGLELSEALKLPGVDFLVDVTVPEAHCAVTLAALGAGLPVLGEKPMASSVEEGRRMVAAAGAAGKLYMVSQSRRYDPNIAAFCQQVRDSLGPIAILNADFYRGPHFGGFRDEMPSPLLLDMAIHTFDQARFVSGEDAVSVYAEEFNPSWSWYKGDACTTALFEMTNGLKFNYRGSWCANGLDTSWQAEWRAHGPNGAAKWDGETAPTVELVGADGARMGYTAQTLAAPGGIEGSLASSSTPWRPALRRTENATTTSRAWRWSSRRSSRQGRACE